MHIENWNTSIHYINVQTANDRGNSSTTANIYLAHSVKLILHICGIKNVTNLCDELWVSICTTTLTATTIILGKNETTIEFSTHTLVRNITKLWVISSRNITRKHVSIVQHSSKTHSVSSTTYTVQYIFQPTRFGTSGTNRTNFFFIYEYATTGAFRSFFHIHNSHKRSIGTNSVILTITGNQRFIQTTPTSRTGWNYF